VTRAFVLALVATRVAHADPSVVATQPLALVTRGVEVSYEQLATGLFSWAAFVGARLAAEDDYDSSTFTAGGELRWWPRRRTPMRGPYLAVHASAGRTTVSDDMGTLGAVIDVTERVDAGWRWVVARHLSLTPSLGAGFIEEVDESGRLATTGRLTVAFGFELGWWSGN
jgi:hypothetical protein